MTPEPLHSLLPFALVSHWPISPPVALKLCPRAHNINSLIKHIHFSYLTSACPGVVPLFLISSFHSFFFPCGRGGSHTYVSVHGRNPPIPLHHSPLPPSSFYTIAIIDALLSLYYSSACYVVPSRPPHHPQPLTTLHRSYVTRNFLIIYLERERQAQLCDMPQP